MHIPDAVLSPSTSAVCMAAMVPVWAMAGRRVRASLESRQAPLLALGSACCFTIMMFNIPALGGTTAHPVAGTLIAVILGPWAAVIGVSVALAIQALFFGDGGLLAYGANCFTMAFVLPFVGYLVYRLLATLLKRRAGAAACAAAGSYVGITAAAAVAAIILGLQPALFHEPNGHAFFFPFGLQITLPAMLGTHLLVAGPAEAIVTGLAVKYLLAAGVPLYGRPDTGGAMPVRREMLWVALFALAALSPLGLLAKGEAWGEWNSAGLRQQVQRVVGEGYVPKGVTDTEPGGYHGVHGLDDYAADKGWRGYLGSALLGVTTISAILLVGGRLLARGGRSAENAPVAAAPRPTAGALPEWLTRLSEETAPRSQAGRRTNRYIERTLSDIASATGAALAAETIPRGSGYLQSIDGRARLIAFLALIGVTSVLRSFTALATIYSLVLLLAAASHVPILAFARRVWLSVPLFVGAVVLPAALNVVTPGRELLVLWVHPHLAVTAPGLSAALLLTARVGVAVSLATLLTITIPWNDLLRALRGLMVPKLFVHVLSMAYRYLLVLLRTTGETALARRSRTVGPASNREGRRFVGSAFAMLIARSLALSEEVHSAMLSRGYTGEAHALSRPVWRMRESIWAVGITAVAIVALTFR